MQDPSGEYTDYGAADNNYNEYGEGFYDSAPEEGNGYEDGKEGNIKSLSGAFDCLLHLLLLPGYSLYIKK